MKVMKLMLSIAVLFMIFEGCTAYQLSSKSKNVAIENISADTFTVSFCAGAYMKKEEVEKYALQRASEEALAKGCSRFFVVKKRDDSQFCAFNPKKSLGSTSEFPEKDYPLYEGSSFMKPNVTLTLQCVPEGKEIKENVIDAKKFLRENFPGLEE